MSLQNNLGKSEKAVERLARRRERELLVAYSRSLREIKSQVASMYEKYGTRSELPLSEVQKYNRLKNLEDNIAKEVGKLTSAGTSKIKAGMRETYQESYYRTAFAVEREAQAKLGFGQLSTDAVNRAIENELDSVGFIQRNRENNRRLVRQVRSELTQGLVQGESYQQTANRLTRRFEVGANEAVRIARTENHRVQSKGRLDSFDRAEKAGVIAKRVWVATLDSSTRDTHQDMDGAVANEDGMFDLNGTLVEGPGLTGIAEEDINCRCTVRMEIEGYEPELRRSRGEGVIPHTTYNDWKENRIG